MFDFSKDPIWLNMHKPAGYSSAKVVAIVKRFTRAKKVGHGGTLDPFATGVLPIALNRATKTSQKMMDCEKEYYFKITWGEFRDSDDIDGKVIEISDIRPNAMNIVNSLPYFVGSIKQQPSKFSAIKINGKRAYELARKDVDFEIGFRDVDIFALKMLSCNESFGEFEVKCSKGTYVRSLARDICKKVGVCGYVSELMRQKVGKFDVEDAIFLDQLKIKRHYGGNFLDGSLITCEEPPLDSQKDGWSKK
ncbi:MAG: tRNA pseudouridine(55) synthase TruB [Rickettsiales bacterium]|nr:tRNA pseudouridine(55) synthase TruB [Rickettsiales bacterium]